MAYEIHLENFEGPLDLLLHLIRKNEMDVYDIPMAEITTQYLASLDEMKSLNLDVGWRIPADGGHPAAHKVTNAPAADK